MSMYSTTASLFKFFLNACFMLVLLALTFYFSYTAGYTEGSYNAVIELGNYVEKKGEHFLGIGFNKSDEMSQCVSNIQGHCDPYNPMYITGDDAEVQKKLNHAVNTILNH